MLLLLFTINSFFLISERSCVWNFIRAIATVLTLSSPHPKVVCLRVAPVWRRRDRIVLLIGLLPSQSYIVSNLSAIKIHLHFTLSNTFQSQVIPALNWIIINRSMASVPCRQLPKSSWICALIHSTSSCLYCVEGSFTAVLSQKILRLLTLLAKDKCVFPISLCWGSRSVACMAWCFTFVFISRRSLLIGVREHFLQACSVI